MAVHQSTVHPARKPFWRRERFWRVTLPVAAVAAAIVAGVLVYNAYVGSSGMPNSAPSVIPPPPAKNPPTVKLDRRIMPLVQTWLHTAVARRDLRQAYALAGPQVKQGMSLKEWLSGNIAVVPFDVDRRTSAKLLKVSYSYANRAQLQVFLATPGRSVKNSPHTFFVDLIKRHGTWLVNGWVPRWTPPIPTVPGR